MGQPTEQASYRMVAERELDTGVAYAFNMHGVSIDPHLLRTLVNTTLRDRKKGVSLAWTAATVVRDHVPESAPQRTPTVEAYKSAIMKVMSDRSVHASKRAAAMRTRDAVKRGGNARVIKHPEDPRHRGQLLLI